MGVATQDIAIIALLLIISAVGIATLSLRLPYPIALVLAGLALGAIIHSRLPLFHDLPLDTLEFTPHLILVAFLPALLFEAEEQRSTQAHLLQVDRSTLQELRRQELVDDDTSRKLAESLDTRLMAVRSGVVDQASPAAAADAQVVDERASDAPTDLRQGC
jgi:hypothetical protein